MSTEIQDTASELLIAELLEEDLRALEQVKELEQAQLAQTLTDSALASGKIPKKVSCISEQSDVEIALAMLTADVRMSTDAAYAQALQHSDDAASIASRQYAQRVLAAEKKIALDAEFARRLQQMENDGEMDVDDSSIYDAERVLGKAEIDSIIAANPNDKGKGKAPIDIADIRGAMRPKLEPQEVKLEEDDSQPIQLTIPSCGICLEQFQLVHSPNNASKALNASSSTKLHFGLALPCTGSHNYCQDCLRSYIQSKIDPEGDGTGNPNTVVFPIKCPECPITQWPSGIEDGVASRVLSEKDMLLWHHQKLLDTLPRLYCPNARCSALVQAHDDPDQPQAECPVCKTLMCVPCRVLWHEEMSCEEYQALPLDERSPEDQQALQLMRAQNWRRCPNCAVIVELTMGCNHITCRCGSHFCFKCGSKWDVANVRCTRVPNCDLWDEDMLLEQRERAREAPARRPEVHARAMQPPAYQPFHVDPPPYVPNLPYLPFDRRPNDLQWMFQPGSSRLVSSVHMQEPPVGSALHSPKLNAVLETLRPHSLASTDTLCTRHWFTASMISHLTCQYCDVRLNSLADLQYHLAHTRRHEVFACCGRFFKREVDFERHIEAQPRRFGSHIHQVRR